jgi:hypothetical protein
VVPVGGGSGAAGTCLVAKAIRPSIEVIGVRSVAVVCSGGNISPAQLLAPWAGQLVVPARGWHGNHRWYHCSFGSDKRSRSGADGQPQCARATSMILMMTRIIARAR